MGRTLLHLYQISPADALSLITVLISILTFPLEIFLGLPGGDRYSGKQEQRRDTSAKMEFRKAICSFFSASSAAPL
jgi:hypothetical protein